MKSNPLFVATILAGLIVDGCNGRRGTKARRRQVSSGRSIAIEGEFPSLNGANEWLNSPPLTPAEPARESGADRLLDVYLHQLAAHPAVCPRLGREVQGSRIGGHRCASPEFSFEQKIDNVRTSRKGMRVDYPVAIDNDYAIWHAFDNQYWPALYFVDAKGNVRHHQFGEGEYERSERVIQQLLTEAGNSGVSHDLVEADARGVEVAADWGNLKSPENYLGSDRTRNFASPGSAIVGKSRNLRCPGAVEAQSLGPFGRLDGGERCRSAQQGQRTHRLSLSRPRSSPRHGTGLEGILRALSRAHRWSTRRHRAWNRRRRARQRRGYRAAALSAGPTTPAHYRSPVRDRISRFRRRGFCVYVRLIRGFWETGCPS